MIMCGVRMSGKECRIYNHSEMGGYHMSNFNQFPEGWAEAIGLLDFLPEETDRNQFMAGLVMFLMFW